MSQTKNPDPWGMGHRYTVGAFRAPLEKIAAEFTAKGAPTESRLNAEDGCAELYAHSGRVVMKIRAVVDREKIEKAVVRSQSLLPGETKHAFEKALSPVAVYFEVLPFG